MYTKYSPYRMEARRRILPDAIVSAETSRRRFAPDNVVAIDSSPLITRRIVNKPPAAAAALNAAVNAAVNVVHSRSNTPTPTGKRVTAPPTQLTQSEDGLTLFAAPLSENVLVQARLFRGKLAVDIRRWIRNNNGGYIPTKKGIALNPVCWATLMYEANDISETLERIKNKEQVCEKKRLSGAVFTQMASPFWTVNIREHYKDKKDGVIRPSYKGIILRHGEWETLMQLAPLLKERVPELAEATPCILSPDHQNQEGSLQCSECYPWGYD